MAEASPNHQSHLAKPVQRVDVTPEIEDAGESAEAGERALLASLHQPSFGSGRLSPRNALALQRKVGNQAMQQVMQRGTPNHAAPGAGPSQLRAPTHTFGHDMSTADIDVHSAYEDVETDVHVQRHSSWEHKLLGDTDPRKIAMMGATGDVGSGMTVGNDDTGYQVITPTHIKHALEEEIARTKKFRDSALFQDRQKTKEAAEKAEAQIRDWGMVPVTVTMEKGGYEVLTYGEVNTLPDLFGSVEEMKKHDPQNFHQVVQGIRQQSLYNIMSVYEKFGGTKEKRKGFKGAIGSTGYTKLPKFMQGKIGVSSIGAGTMGELALMGELQVTVPLIGAKIGATPKKQAKGKEEESYKAGLARNACHFAPESWHSWADSHKKAIELATQSYTKTEESKRYRQQAAADPKSADGYNGLANQSKKEAARLGNEAMLTNGFGDHFLQDSFAAGHLINKTEIMKWYVQWLDANPQYAEGVAIIWNPFKERGNVNRTRRKPVSPEVWAPAKAMSDQKGIGVGKGRYDTSKVGATKAADPQSVENTEGTWEDRFKAAGLEIPGSAKVGTKSQKFLVWWQRKVVEKRDNAEMTFNAKSITKAAATSGLSEADVVNSLINLTADSVSVKTGKDSYKLREVWMPGKTKEEVKAFSEATREGGTPEEQAKRKVDYERAAARAVQKDYHGFLNSAMIQAATNVLHDIFCKNGLVVASEAETLPFKIYGDDAMLAANSSKGVEISAITSNMSRDNIVSIIDTGKEKHPMSTISARFPSKVEADALGKKQVMSLEAWHTSGALKGFCDTTAFPTASFDIIKGWKVSDKKKLVELSEKVSKDQLKQDYHSGEAF